MSSNPLCSLRPCIRILALTGAIVFVLHVAARSAFAIPIVFGGHLNCSDPASCTVKVTFGYTDPAAADPTPTLLPVIIVHPNAAGLFVAETASSKDAPDASISDLWSAIVSIMCPCYQPISTTYNLAEGSAGLKDIADLAFQEALLHLIAESVGAPSIPVLLSTEFVGEEGAEDIPLTAIPDCPEPSSLWLLGTPLLAGLGRRWYAQKRERVRPGHPLTDNVASGG